MPADFERLRTALAAHYTILRKLGRGGMATVYLAEDLKHHRSVAVKVFDPDLVTTLAAERFLREVEVTANLTHPHILPLHDSGQADGLLYYVMPYIEGETLRERLKREGQLPLEDALQIAREVAAALSYAHSHDVIHRDIKPENILLSAGEAVVADFGIAKALSEAGGEHLTATGVSLGTPAYMSPEQASAGEAIDPRSDLYSLGCVLYEMLAGEPPYTGPTAQAVLAKKLSEATPHVSVVREAVPDTVELALLKVLAKIPADRFATAKQFAEALSTDRVSVAAPAPRPVAHRVLAALAGVAVAAAAAVLTWRYLGAADPGPPSPDRPYTVLAAVGGSADSTMREMVEYLMRSGLDVSHVVQTVPDVEVRRGLTLMERSPTEPLDPMTARELAERYGVPTVVLPRLDPVGTGFVVAVRVENVADGQLRAEASRRAAAEGDVIETVDAVVDELRRDLGETRAALANTPPLPQVLTPSLEALRRFRDGRAAKNAGRPRQAIALLREALALDPEFAEARIDLGVAYWNLGHRDSAIAEQRPGLETPERLSDIRRRDMERFVRLETDFALWDESMFQGGYPNNMATWLMSFRYLDSALAVQKSHLRNAAKRLRQFDPERRIVAEGLTWGNARRWAAWSGRLAELAALRDSLRVDPTPFWDWLSSLASAEWDRADSLRLAVPDREGDQWFLAVLDAARGRIRASHERTTSLRGPLEPFYIKDQVLAIEVVYGVRAPTQSAKLTDRGYSAVEDYLVHGVRAALLGDTTEAKRVFARLRAASDSATSEVFERRFAPRFELLEAGVATRRGDWQAAAAILEPTVRRLQEQGYGGPHDPYLIGWVLADVYAQLGHLEHAILQLEDVLQGPTWYTHSAAHFELGLLYSQVGDTTKSLRHYGTFLEAFTDPDPEYEWMVKEAQAEVVRLS